MAAFPLPKFNSSAFEMKNFRWSSVLTSSPKIRRMTIDMEDVENEMCSTVKSNSTVVQRKRKMPKRPSPIAHLKNSVPDDPFTTYVEQTFSKTAQKILLIVRDNPFLEGISPDLVERLTRSSLVESAFLYGGCEYVSQSEEAAESASLGLKSLLDTLKSIELNEKELENSIAMNTLQAAANRYKFTDMTDKQRQKIHRLRSNLTCELRETMSDLDGKGIARFIQLTMLLAQLRDVCSPYQHHFSKQFKQQFQF